MNRLERKAALAVAAAAAGVVVSGVSLLKKHSKYLTQKAAATFDPDGDEDWFDEAETVSGEGALKDAGGKENGSEDTAAKGGKLKDDPADEQEEEKP